MPKASPLQSDFSGGEYNPLFFGRVDSDRYKQGLDTCKNYVPIIQGPVTRRPGSYYAGAAGGSNVLLIPFQASVLTSFIVEIGAGYIRFWKNYAQVMSGMSPYSISNPFSLGDLSGLRWVQDNDVIYITHPNYSPFTLSYFSDTAWSLNQPFLFGGPYLPTVVTTQPTNPGPYIGGLTTTMEISATSGTWPGYTSTLITAAAFFKTTDVGRPILLLQGPTWVSYVILAYSSSTSVTITPFFDDIFVYASAYTGVISAYKLGAWNSTTGFPSCVTFHEDRLVFSGVAAYPNRIDGSRTSDYKNFIPINPDGSVPDSASYSFTLNASTLNQVEWLESTEQALIAGSLGGEWTIKASVQGEALTPSNVSAKLTSYWGSAPMRPVKAGKSTIHVQRGGKKVREMMYRFEYAGFISTELTELAGHITSGRPTTGIPLGINALAYQQNPYAVIWVLRNDGQLIGATFDHDAQSLRTGWHRHQLGGVSDSNGNAPFIQSIAVIPSPDGTRDDLWMAVVRTVNGSSGVYIEYLSKYFEDTDEQKDAHCLDFGAVYDQPVSIASITQANPAVVTASAHGFSNGNLVILEQVEGMTHVNGLTFTVAGVTTNTFQLSGFDSTALLSGTGGQARKKVSTVSGLGYLEGTTVQVYADGALQPDQLVSSGAITLSEPAGTVHVGLSYQSDLRLLPIEAGAAGGTALGKTRRTQRVGLYLHRTLGLKFGFSFDALDELDFTTLDQITGVAPALYTGIKSETTDSDYDFYNQFCIRQETALPGTILAIAPMQETQDRG